MEIELWNDEESESSIIKQSNQDVVMSESDTCNGDEPESINEQSKEEVVMLEIVPCYDDEPESSIKELANINLSEYENESYESDCIDQDLQKVRHL